MALTALIDQSLDNGDRLKALLTPAAVWRILNEDAPATVKAIGLDKRVIVLRFHSSHAIVRRLSNNTSTERASATLMRIEEALQILGPFAKTLETCRDTPDTFAVAVVSFLPRKALGLDAEDAWVTYTCTVFRKR